MVNISSIMQIWITDWLKVEYIYIHIYLLIRNFRIIEVVVLWNKKSILIHTWFFTYFLESVGLQVVKVFVWQIYLNDKTKNMYTVFDWEKNLNFVPKSFNRLKLVDILKERQTQEHTRLILILIPGMQIYKICLS